MLELNLDSVIVDNPFLTVALDDFNAKSSLLYNSDITTHEDSKIDGVISQIGLQKMIKQPTHIIGDSSSCIGLIFTAQPNLVMESGIHFLLDANCHLHITSAKFNLKIQYPLFMSRKSGIIRRLILTKLDKCVSIRRFLCKY